MTKAEKLRHCVGCEQNFYNGNNPMGVKECWSLKTARLVKRVRVSLSQRPPWNQPPVSVFQCRQERGFVLMDVRTRDANTRAYEESVYREIAELKAEPCDCEGDYQDGGWVRRTCARCARLIEFGVTPPERVAG